MNNRGGQNVSTQCKENYDGPLCSGCTKENTIRCYSFGQYICFECPISVVTILYIIGYILGLILFILFIVR